MRDSISREGAIDAVMKYGKQIPTFAIAVKDALENLPSAQPEPERGFWYPIQRGEQGYSAGDFRCSVCGQPNHCSHVTKYCCNCGAKMER